VSEEADPIVGHEWTGRAGPVKCPRFGHLYVKWLNYEQMF